MNTGNTTPHLLVGEKGEDNAARFLQQYGYHILDRNIRVGRHDEIDIIAVDPQENVLVFVEVKTRSRVGADYLPSLNLTREKRERMFRAARRWMDAKKYDGGYRFDLVGIAGATVVEHILDVRVRDERRCPKRSWLVVPW